jgi:hypothetical protein
MSERIDQADSEPHEVSGRRPRLIVTGIAAATVVLATVLLRDQGGQESARVTPSPAAPPRAVPDGEFCRAYDEMNIAFGALVQAPSSDTTRGLKEAASGVGDLVDGTGMSESAKQGARFITTSILGLGDVADSADIAAFDEIATIDDTANARALGEHVATACAAGLRGSSR